MKKNYYKRLDIIRIISCIAVLLYHLDILKGGYLAVCTFFVLSGYLAVVSAMSKEKFSLKDYYINRFKKIYLPLLVVVFSTITVISFMSSINWLNLKPETTSVLLGYNNFWQLNANLDYFVRHISSPFMHLWYIAILLQFELVFPFVFVILKNIGKKISKTVLCLLCILLGLLSFVLFFKTVKNGDIMSAYYGTFTRLFSLIFGMLIGFVHSYKKQIIIKDKNINKFIFIFYLVILIVMFIFLDVNFWSVTISMGLSTIVTMRLIDYSIVNSNNKNKVVSSFSSVSYEVYLVQYPVIFIFQSFVMNEYLKVFLIILITIVLSYIIHTGLNLKKAKLKSLSICLLLIISVSSMYGLYKFIITEDHTAEMKRLEEKLNENSKLIEEQKQKYLEQQKNEEDEWNKILENLNAGEEELKETVKNMRVVGIGDSIMELAVRDLYKQFPNGYFDAMTNRTENKVNDILKDLKSKNMLGDVIVLNIGTNGGWIKDKSELLEIVGDRKIFWLNATNPDYSTFNGNLIDFASKHDNVYIIDWITVMKENPGYLISDKVHPTVKGCKLYAETIYNALYDYYLKEYNKVKEEKIKEYEEKKNQKIVFIGNELLLGMYDYLHSDYSDSEFVIDKEFTFESLKEKIKAKIDDKSLSHNVVLMLDKKIKISKNDYDELIEMLKNYNLYIIDIDNKLEISNDNVSVIDFISEIKENDKYVSFDGIHLTDDGSKALQKIIYSKIKSS